MVMRPGVSVYVLGRFVAAIVALIALGTCLSFAQTSTATILGTVKDASGALIPGVSITVKHTESGLARTVVSGERGGYNVPLLPVGPYEITTTMPGFKQQSRSGRKPTGSSLTASTGLAGPRPASSLARRERAGNCWVWKRCGNSTFSPTPTARSTENGPEVRSTL